MCLVCRAGDCDGWAFCTECRLDCSIMALGTADRVTQAEPTSDAVPPDLFGPRVFVRACRALARARASEADVHLVAPGPDVRRRWRRLMAGEGYAGALAVAELLALFARRGGSGAGAEKLELPPSAVSARARS